MPDYIVLKTAKEKRKITCINGYAFYQSTGRNSGFPGTWFPFLGLADPESNNPLYKRDSNINGKGHLIKPNIYSRDIPENTEDYGKDLGLSEEFFTRIGNLECLLISSLMNEGYWQTEQGTKFKQHLKETNKIFYEEHKGIEFSKEPLQQIPASEPQKVNAWILEQGVLKEILPLKLTKTLTSNDKRKQFAKGKISPRQTVDLVLAEVELQEEKSLRFLSLPVRQNEQDNVKTNSEPSPDPTKDNTSKPRRNKKR